MFSAHSMVSDYPQIFTWLSLSALQCCYLSEWVSFTGVSRKAGYRRPNVACKKFQHRLFSLVFGFRLMAWYSSLLQHRQPLMENVIETMLPLCSWYLMEHHTRILSRCAVYRSWGSLHNISTTYTCETNCHTHRVNQPGKCHLYEGHQELYMHHDLWLNSSA